MYWAKYFGVDKFSEGETISLINGEYVLIHGILRQKEIYSDSQKQTKDTFGYKWAKRDTYESPAMQGHIRTWCVDRYFKGDITVLNQWLPDGAKVLDAGCGSGVSSLLLLQEHFPRVDFLGVDISTAVDVAQTRFQEAGCPAEFMQADILNLPFSQPIFDFIISERVLHHTDSTELAIKYLSRFLVKDGRFLFYVYRQKAPIREFSDDYIRKYLEGMNDEEAWDALIPLTKLGKVLGDLNITVDVPESVPYLEIPSGKIDLQRLFYWYICKAFYKPEWKIDEMNHVNFDWYRPLNCHRQTPEQVRAWCEEAGLAIDHMDVQEAGITVVARKR